MSELKNKEVSLINTMKRKETVLKFLRSSLYDISYILLYLQHLLVDYQLTMWPAVSWLSSQLLSCGYNCDDQPCLYRVKFCLLNIFFKTVTLLFRFCPFEQKSQSLKNLSNHEISLDHSQWFYSKIFQLFKNEVKGASNNSIAIDHLKTEVLAKNWILPRRVMQKARK